ncbi:MAG: DUF4230 domain-containing protein [Emticicia sp.]|uniref:DUF4230 domain-containing protein n=1 Tax=Emticicia aquatilis TaxID=1537369 RepID=A0A917DLI1_9BACT|nr:DUF4230 domain-containing protein [Emticicia aquatilis]GGD46008.1 hypothetical protein GCM10011514_07510 [Emticicia aquatilis]
MEFLLFLVAIAIGGIAAWQIFNWMYGKKLRDNKEELRQESTLLLERIEKVFKVVMAEGYFTEIYDHSSKKEFMGFFKVNKKALVVSRAKVSVGFDFGKMKVKRDETTRKLVVEQFPEAEILSIDTDYKFYDIDQGWLNKFNHEDYTNILNEAKKVMQEKALTSDLPRVANRQVGLMMSQLAASMNWEVEFKQLPISEQKTLAEFADFQEVKE